MKPVLALGWGALLAGIAFGCQGSEPLSPPETFPDLGPLQDQIVFMGSQPDGNSDLYVIGVQGDGLVRLTSHPAHDGRPSVSPDGRRIAFESGRAGNFDIYVMDLQDGVIRRVTDHPADDWDPSWSPDGTQLAFVSNRHELPSRRGDPPSNSVYVVGADGARPPTRLTFDRDWQPAWSPQGDRVAFTRGISEDRDVWTVRVDGTDLRRLTDNPGSDHSAAWSPDGSRIVFERSRPEGSGLHVMDADGSNVRRLTDWPGSTQTPAWNPAPLVVYSSTEGGGGDDLHVLDPDTGERRLLVDLPFPASSPAWSP